ncbi:MAG: hypothetical protein RBG13Loki_0832 [Promethearchaeota archaeon CR_4]|nr:MAG: hypothetical protein RBG13Loki_0832 [Candidatus Lokiarchaeota archaeon CR_4]
MGIFLVRKYEFHHLTKVKTFKETQNQVTQEFELTDIPNEDGRLIALDKGERFLGNDPDKVPSLTPETVQTLKLAREEFERENNELPHLIFDQYAYRELPELAVQFAYHGKEYKLKGRGFKPLQKKYFEMDKLPVSWPRIFLLGFLPPLLWIVLSFIF